MYSIVIGFTFRIKSEPQLCWHLRRCNDQHQIYRCRDEGRLVAYVNLLSDWNIIRY